MKNKRRLILAVTMCFFTVIYIGFNGFSYIKIHSKITPEVLSRLETIDQNGKLLVWLKFTDKGDNIRYLLENPHLYLTQRSIERRMIRRNSASIADERDLPVNYQYINDLQRKGVQIKNKSKWFNSVSASLTREQMFELTFENYIEKIELVRTFKTDPKQLIDSPHEEYLYNELNYENIPSLDYGPSLLQSQLINVPPAHDGGYRGQGVLIACFDSGFDNLQHPAFDSVMARGVRTYDFVNGDTIVANVPGRPGDGAHGTRVLSLIVGFAPGELISPGYWANVILAKTENTETETPIEEDNWVAASEWADSLGADVISSSLGYLGMDSGSAWSYDWTWMSGDSCYITKGANIAAENGIVVVNSAGNMGFNPDRNTLVAPADGFYVLTVGALNTSGERANYSSVGLTIDGRVKPDVTAMGTSNVTAQPGEGNTGYTDIGSGTSFSCPMVSGVVAMMLSANRNLTPFQVMDILRATSSNSSDPNRLIGWGTVDAWAAVNRALIYISNPPGPVNFRLDQNYPNPFNPETVIRFLIDLPGINPVDVKLKIYNSLGEEVAFILNDKRVSGYYEVSWDATGMSAGVYFCTLSIGDSRQTKKMVYLK